MAEMLNLPDLVNLTNLTDATREAETRSKPSIRKRVLEFIEQNPDWTQQQIADEVGCSRQYVTEVEASKNSESDDSLAIPDHINGNTDRADFRKLPSELQEQVREREISLNAAAIKAGVRKIFDMWLACHTEQEIAEAVGMTQQAISKVLQPFQNFESVVKLGQCSEVEDESERAAAVIAENSKNANHQIDFEPPIYNVWKQQEKTAGSSHFVLTGWRVGRWKRSRMQRE